MVDLNEVIQLGETPIPGEQVAGVSVRYEPEYEVVSGEVGKLESLEGEEVNWNVVVNQSFELLRDKTKDVLIAVYLSAGLYEQEGLSGLESGIKMLHNMTKTFWEEAFPEVTRLRARRSAFSWFSERIEGQLNAKLEWTGDDLRAAKSCFETLSEFRLHVDALMDGDDGMGGINRSLRERSSQADALGAEPEIVGDESAAGEEAAPADGAPVASTSAGVAAAPVAVADGKIHTREQAFARLAEVNEFLNAYEPHSPIACLLSRAIRWSNMSFDDVFDELLEADSDALDRMRSQLGIRSERDDDDD